MQKNLIRTLLPTLGSVSLAVALLAVCLYALQVAPDFTARAESDVHPAAWTEDDCAPGDLNCDGVYNILDMQLLVKDFGLNVSLNDRRDLNGDGIIDAQDLAILGGAWRMRPGTLLGGLPRLGYAVNPDGYVFLRWAIPVSPYAADVDVVRDPPTAGAAPAVNRNAGVIATVSPIYDEAEALRRLGGYWPLLRTGFTNTVDAEGAPLAVELDTVAEMHAYAESGANPVLVNTLSNQDPGVARVFGKGYYDADIQPGQVYTYWVRYNGRVVGPVRVRTTQTSLPAPTGVNAFVGDVNVPPAAEVGAVVRLRMLRGAHAAAFLTWDPTLAMRPSSPIWHQGFNVHRQDCDLDGTNCTALTQVNDVPIFPKGLAEDAIQPYATANDALEWGQRVSDFDWYWADHDLDTSRLYCYRVTALDLLQQDGEMGRRSATGCLQPPDFLPPEAPEITRVETLYHGKDTPADIEVSWLLDGDEARNGDLLEFKLYRSLTATASWPDEWTQVAGVRPNVWNLPASAVDKELAVHTQFWYRVVAIDRSGNMSEPSPPALGTVDDIYPPNRPVAHCAQFGQECPRQAVNIPPDAAYVRIYRSFSPDGIPVLVERIPADDWYVWQDAYQPNHQLQVYYHLIAEDASGNVSEPSDPFGELLGIGQVLEISTPVITGTTWSKIDPFTYRVQVEWTASAAGYFTQYRLYRSQGPNPPASIGDMVQVSVETVSTQYTGPGDKYFTVEDTDYVLAPNELFWYAIVVKGLGTDEKVSKPFATRYIELGDELTREVQRWPGGGGVQLNPNDSIAGVQLYVEGQHGCCWVFLRSQSENGGYSQISPIIDQPLYFDTDVYRGMGPLYYQALKIDAGRGWSPNIDFDHITGEIIGASTIIPVQVPELPIPDNAAESPIGPISIPSQFPTHLVFGENWVVRVFHYDAGSVLSDLSGEAEVRLAVAPDQLESVRVRFDGVNAATPNNRGQSQVLGINPGGEARVMIGMIDSPYTPRHPNRMVTALSNLRLDENGATAHAVFLGYGRGLNLWNVDAPGVGFPNPLQIPDLEILSPSLDWRRVVPRNPGQTCSDPLTNADLPFAVSDWPLFVVPTGVFTVSHGGIEFTTTCTAYRDRYSGLSTDVSSPNLEIDYRNDHFLQPVYTSSGASYEVARGLSGTWAGQGTHAYTAASPYGFGVKSDGRRFTLVNGRMTEGELNNTTLTFDYAHEVDHAQTATFQGSFGDLTIGPNGALYGSGQGSEVQWTALSIDLPDYALYIPPAHTPRMPLASWIATRGTEASGVPGARNIHPGLNAGDRDLLWTVCPAATAGAPARFIDNSNSTVGLYARRGGITGRVDMLPVNPVSTLVAGYQTEFSRFAMSWLDNLPVESGIAGKFILPYPADIELAFDALWLDTNGCVDSGAVIPQEETLEYWQIPVIPRVVEIRPSELSLLNMHFCKFCPTVNRLWLLGEYFIRHLTQAEGAGGNLVEVDIAFNPSGTFFSADVFPAETVYSIDGFYVVLNDLRLSSYSAADPPASERPAWNTNYTIEQPPSAFTGPTAQGNAGFVALRAGVYLPLFGQATNPNTSNIYVLGEEQYIGFDQRPRPASMLSQALDMELAYEMTYAQGSGGTPSRWIGMATTDSRAISPKNETLFHATHSLIVEPDAARIVFGFPAAAALFLAADEAFMSWPDRPIGNKANRFSGWRDPLGLTLGEFDNDPQLAAHFYNLGFSDYRSLVTDINAAVAPLDGAVDQWITDANLGHVHAPAPMLTGIMANSPLQLRWLRGDAVISPITVGGVLVDGKIDRLLVTSQVRVFERAQSGASNQSPLLSGQMLMDLDPQGFIYLGAQRVSGSLLARTLEFDADMRILFSATLGYGIEGGLMLYGLETEAATINKAGAVGGFTLIKGPPSSIGLMYIGATLDLTMNMSVLGNISVGGSMLMGRLDPNSPVLAQQYGDLFKDMKAGSGIIEGAYMLVYAQNIPIYNVGVGCLGISIKGGGEVAFWVFTQVNSPDTAWGTRVGVNAMGKAFCVASAKADIKLTLENSFGQNNLDLIGEAWAGAGCGFCEPETWHTKNDVLNDKWCLKCIIDLYFLIPLKGSNSKADMDFNAACPF